MSKPNRFFVFALGVAAISAASCSRDPQKLRTQLLTDGDRFAAQGKFADAIVDYRKAVAQDGKSGAAREKLGNAYMAIHDFDGAYREYVRAADLMPDNVAAQLRAGGLLLAAGQYAEAKARAVAVVAKEPKNVDALVLLGDALAGMKDVSGAISQIEQALDDTDPRVTLTYENLGLLRMGAGQLGPAEAAFKRAVDLNPRSTQALLNLGGFYWVTNQKDKAEAQFKAAFAIDPRSAAARSLATFYIVNGRPRDAEPYLKAYAATNGPAKLVLADFYLGEGRTKDAVAVLEPLVNDPDGSVPARLRLSAIDFQEDRRPQAYHTLDDILKRDPTNEPTIEMKARFLAREARYTEAIKLVDATLNRNPNALPSLYIRATALQANGSLDAALSTFQELLTRAPSSVRVQLAIANLYLIRNDGKAAADFLATALKQNPTAPGIHYLLGQALLRTGDAVGAEREFVTVANQFPASADVQTWLGLVYQTQRHFDRSRAAFNRAAALQPQSIIALAGMVSQDLTEKRNDAARQRIGVALATSPRDAALLLLAGNTYMAMGDGAKAESAYETLLQVDPSNIAAFSRLAVLYHSQGRLDQAKGKYEEIVRRQEHPVMALTLLGMILDLQKQTDDAEARYQQALKIDPKAAIAANNLAWMYAESGENLDEALELAQTAKAQLPDTPQVDDTLGWVYYKKGLNALAVSFLGDAARRGPNADTQYRLGLAYLKNGDKRNARLSFEQALKLNPQFEKAVDARRELASLKG